MGGKKATLPILPSFEDPHSIDTIYPQTVTLTEKVACKFGHSPVLIKELCRQKLDDPCWDRNRPTCVLLLVGFAGSVGAERGSASIFRTPKAEALLFNLHCFTFEPVKSI